MSGFGGPLSSTPGGVPVDEALACFGGVIDDAVPDEAMLATEAERAGIARRIGAIAAACQREAVEGMVPLSIIEMRLVTLSDDVRAGIHGGGR